MKKIFKIGKTITSLLLLLVMSCYASDENRMTIDDLKKMSLTELMNVEIFNPSGSLAARKIQKLSETPAALFVLTQEDIRRAGITSIPEALRMVPGYKWQEFILVNGLLVPEV
jgi:iron complex outermembrane receptor protein